MQVNTDKLVEELHSYLQTNPSKDLPYHNNKHMVSCYSIGTRIFVEELRANPRLILEKNFLAKLATVTMLHDYDHTGGRSPDSVNIQRALIGFRGFLEFTKFDLDEEFTTSVTACIQVTEFPFTKQPIGLLEQVMRDADILYATLSGDPEVIMEGLRKEVSVARGSEMSYSEMLEGQAKFKDTVTMFTVEGRRLYEPNKDIYFNSLVEYVESKKA